MTQVLLKPLLYIVIDNVLLNISNISFFDTLLFLVQDYSNANMLNESQDTLIQMVEAEQLEVVTCYGRDIELVGVEI